MALKIAVVGIGKVAREEYLPVLAREPDVELGYWNRTPDAARAATEKFGGRTFAALEDIAAWRPDAVMVLTSERARYEIAKTLLEGGPPRMFFEKPLVAMAGQASVTEEDFLKGCELLRLAKERRCETAMVFNYRFFEQTLRAKALAQSRNFGKVTNITALVHFACWSHCIDLIRHFAGDIAQIAALDGGTHASQELSTEASDVAAAFVTESGASGTIIGTLAMQWQHPLYELTFTFQRGRLHLRDLDGTLEILDPAIGAHEHIALVRDHSRWDAYRDSFRKAVTAYIASVRERRPPPVPGIDGLRELQIEAALRRAARERRTVRIAEEFPIGALGTLPRS